MDTAAMMLVIEFDSILSFHFVIVTFVASYRALGLPLSASKSFSVTVPQSPHYHLTVTEVNWMSGANLLQCFKMEHLYVHECYCIYCHIVFLSCFSILSIDSFSWGLWNYWHPLFLLLSPSSIDAQFRVEIFNTFCPSLKGDNEDWPRMWCKCS